MERFRCNVPHIYMLIDILGVTGDSCGIMVACVQHLESFFLKSQIETAATAQEADDGWIHGCVCRIMHGLCFHFPNELRSSRRSSLSLACQLVLVVVLEFTLDWQQLRTNSGSSHDML